MEFLQLRESLVKLIERMSNFQEANNKIKLYTFQMSEAMSSEVS